MGRILDHPAQLLIIVLLVVILFGAKRLPDAARGLGKSLREKRAQSGLTQAQLARRIGSSQSRVAKMEAADASVSLDLMIRALLALQAKPSEITRAIHRAGR